MLVLQVTPVLRGTEVCAYEAERRIAVVGDELAPGEAGERGEVAGKALLELCLQGAVV